MIHSLRRSAKFFIFLYPNLIYRAEAGFSDLPKSFILATSDEFIDIRVPSSAGPNPKFWNRFRIQFWNRILRFFNKNQFFNLEFKYTVKSRGFYIFRFLHFIP